MITYIQEFPQLSSTSNENTIFQGQLNRLPIHFNFQLEGVVSRIIRSPLFWAATLTLFTAVTLPTATILSPGLALLPTCSMIGLAILGIVEKKKLWFEVSLLTMRIQSTFSCFLHRYIVPCVQERKWYNEIDITQQESQGRIILGALPLATMNHHMEILALAGSPETLAVLSVLESFENNQASLIGNPVRPCDWQDMAVMDFTNQRLQINTPDLTSPSLEDINESVCFIYENVNLSKRTVYVHCKGGRGRSATIVAAYLMRHSLTREKQEDSKMFVERAVKMVKKNRPQVSLTASQIQQLVKWDAQILR